MNEYTELGDFLARFESSSVEYLRLSFCNLGESGGKLISEKVKDNRTLKFLYLDNNELYDGGGRAIAEVR